MKKWFFSKEKNMIAQKGITLTALVVTIFVMLILAGISIKLTLKDDSLIGNVLKVHESQKISGITNALEVLKASNKIRNSSTNGQMNKYYETPANVQLPSGDIITDKYRISTDLFYFEMNDNYEYKIEETADGDIKIAYQGKIDELEPRIYKSSFGHTKNSITANVEAKRANEYKFYIKTDKNATYGDPIVTKETGYYEFKELQQDTTYYIKVEIVNNVGKVEIEQEITTGVITAPQGEITYGNVEWNSNHKASVYISTKENFYIQYQILNSIEDHLSEDSWITESNIGTGINVNDLEHGNIIYMRLYDGYNVSKTYTTLLIEDKEPPVVTLAQSGKSTSKSVVVNATAIDYEYGLPLTPRYTFYIKEDDKFVLKQTGNSPTYSPTELKHNTKYAIKVEVNDKAGNTGAATLDVTTDEVTQATVEGAIVFGNVNWDSSSANIAITTNTSYQIQYQVNGTDDSKWKLGKSVTGLNANDTIYARLWDGTNGGKYASVTILRENSILTLSELSGTTIYPNSKTFNVKENNSNGNLSVKSSDETIATAKIDGTVVTLTPKNKPGKVTITVTSAQTYRYNEISKIYTLEVIGKQTIVANNNEVTYNGASHSIDNVSSNISGASVKYCDTENGTYTTTKPTYVEVGTYTIYWKIEAEGYETEKGSNTLTIKRADVTTATLNAETSISATSGSVVYGTTNKFKVKASVAGKFTVTSKNTGKVTILNGAETTADANKEYEVIYRGIGVSEDEIDLEVSFIPNDTNNYKTPANKIFKVTVIKQQVASVSNLAVGTDGNVTWTASSNATGYEISIDNTNWTTFTSGSSYLSTITATTGERTVYVRAINSDTANYTTPSSAVSKAVTVYSVALTKGTGVSAVTGAGNYINGATVTLGATVNSGYTWSKWTQTSDGAQVSTTKGYSAAITSNWAYTANATANTYTISYNANGGSGTTMSNTTATYDSKVTISANTYTKTGYTFAGWTTKSNGTDDGYNWTGWSGTWKYIDGQYGIASGKLQLYARWSDTIAPTISLSKETYIEGFDGWSLPSGASIDSDNILTMTANGDARSYYYRIGSDPWYATFDAYTTSTSKYFESNGKGGVRTGCQYYNSSYESTKAQNNYASNGWASSLPLNTWNNNFSFDGYRRIWSICRILNI